MGDRMAILDGGELQQAGVPTEVYARPANEFVAGFVGSPSMNFMNATLETDGPTPAVKFEDGTRIELPAGDVAGIDTQPVRVGIRPEDVQLVETGGIGTTVEVTEPVGSDNYLYLDLAPEFIARVGASITPEPGDPVRVHFPPEHIHVFDDETGESLHAEVAGRSVDPAERTSRAERPQESAETVSSG